MTGENDRFSVQLFSFSKPGHFIKAPKELVDEEHPLLFKLFEMIGLSEYVASQAGYAAPNDAFKAYCDENNIKYDGFNGHTNSNFLTFRSQNQVNDLQINKNGELFDVNISPNSYVVLSGNSFKASFITLLKSVPKKNLHVDEEHPLLFKSFEMIELSEYVTSQAGYAAPSDAFKAYCGENENKSALPSHTDNSYLTIIKQNQNGLQVLYKNGEWIELNHTSPNSYIVLSADVFMVSKELADEEHPLMFKPFKLPEFNKYIMLGAKNGLGVKNYCGL
ncbi:hypothetical protein H5410_000304 [Solanum commersonii]|uniref:Isopenicillin N synthase-like Fe(2+) 2OG dioxygenase domain-containing protein n=1 Tax=Solanum commersonii TaxID=4109 RepID=A0A9J6AWH5_SOLCO|nr:hypothetical protein H5410_000304 [Solanum commersonii]